MKRREKKETDVSKKQRHRGNGVDKLQVKGSFMDILKASAKDAANKSAKKK